MQYIRLERFEVIGVSSYGVRSEEKYFTFMPIREC